MGAAQTRQQNLNAVRAAGRISMFASLRKMVGGSMKSVRQMLTGSGQRNRKPQAKFRPQFDTLEQRDVPTVVFAPQFGPETVTGANVAMSSAKVNVIFSGHRQTAQGKVDETTLFNSLQNIINGPYLSGLTQYGSDGKVLFWSDWNDPATVPSNASGRLQSFLQTSIGKFGGSPGSNDVQHAPIYLVISDPISSAGANGGWNAPGTYNQSVTYTDYFLGIKVDSTRGRSRKIRT